MSGVLSKFSVVVVVFTFFVGCSRLPLFGPGSTPLSKPTQAEPVPDHLMKSWMDGHLAGDVMEFQYFDAFDNEGKGQSDSTDLAVLAWQESHILWKYAELYRVTRQTYWLDKLIDHFDRIRTHATLDAQGYYQWTAKEFSTGTLEAVPEGEVGSLTFYKPTVKAFYSSGGRLVTGHDYRIELTGENEVSVTDLSAGTAPIKLAYNRISLNITQIPGGTLTLQGTGPVGSRFLVKTYAPPELPWLVDDAMFLAPVAAFVEQVLKTPSLPQTYELKAREYLNFLQVHFFEKWESDWRDYADGTGSYHFRAGPGYYFPLASLPHNQYLKVATMCMLMTDVPGISNPGHYRSRAEKMLRRFKNSLQPQADGTLRWNYWDPVDGEPLTNGSYFAEDYSHATIDVEAAVEGYRRGLVFTADDLRKMARTWTDTLWNQDEANPKFSYRVWPYPGHPQIPSELPVRSVFEFWVQLGEFSEKALNLAKILYLRDKRVAHWTPHVLQLYHALRPVTAGEVTAFAEANETFLTFDLRPALFNGQFEYEKTGTAMPLGWSFKSYAADQGTPEFWSLNQFLLAKEPESGNRSLQIRAGTTAPNLVAAPLLRTALKGNPKVTLSFRYRTEAGASGLVSLIEYDASQRSFPSYYQKSLPASANWQTVVWTIDSHLDPVVNASSVTTFGGTTEITPWLRNAGLGSVFYDDVTLTLGN